MEKTLKIDGRDVRFQSTAGTPRRYRYLTGRDMLIDMQKLIKNARTILAEQGRDDISDDDRRYLGSEDLIAFEDIAYTMAKQADPDGVPDSTDDWLDTFETFSVWEVLPDIIELWTLSERTTSQVKNPKAAQAKDP